MLCTSVLHELPKEYGQRYVKGTMFRGSDAWDMHIFLKASALLPHSPCGTSGFRRRTMWQGRKIRLVA
jgi:hypothetical protein